MQHLIIKHFFKKIKQFKKYTRDIKLNIHFFFLNKILNYNVNSKLNDHVNDLLNFA